MTEELAGYFKMLSEPVRLRLLGSICTEGEATIGELTERLGLCQSVVSRHMKLMTEHGIVCKKAQDGRILYYFEDDCLCCKCAPVVEKNTITRGRAEPFALRRCRCKQALYPTKT